MRHIFRASMSDQATSTMTARSVEREVAARARRLFEVHFDLWTSPSAREWPHMAEHAIRGALWELIGFGRRRQSFSRCGKMETYQLTTGVASNGLLQ